MIQTLTTDLLLELLLHLQNSLLIYSNINGGIDTLCSPKKHFLQVARNNFISETVAPRNLTKNKQAEVQIVTGFNLNE